MNKLRKYLREEQHEYNNSDQIQRSGTSIGANYSEACDEVLYGSELISKNQYDELMLDVEEMYRILTASIKTAKSKLK